MAPISPGHEAPGSPTHHPLLQQAPMGAAGVEDAPRGGLGSPCWSSPGGAAEPSRPPPTSVPDSGMKLLMVTVFPGAGKGDSRRPCMKG